MFAPKFPKELHFINRQTKITLLYDCFVTQSGESNSLVLHVHIICKEPLLLYIMSMRLSIISRKLPLVFVKCSCLNGQNKDGPDPGIHKAQSHPKNNCEVIQYFFRQRILKEFCTHDLENRQIFVFVLFLFLKKTTPALRIEIPTFTTLQLLIL